MSPNRARLLVGVAAALVVVLLVVGFMAGEREQHRLDRDRQAESTLEASLRVTRASTASQRRNIKAAAVFGKALAQDLVDAQRGRHAHPGRSHQCEGTRCSKPRATLGSQSARRATVEQCLTGVRRALDATRTRNTAAATSFLRAAAPACQSALAPGARRAGPGVRLRRSLRHARREHLLRVRDERRRWLGAGSARV